MTELRLSHVFGERLVGVEGRFGGGLHVVLGSAADGGDELVALAAGMARPRRGRVALDGRDVHANPELRARVATLQSEERFDGLGPKVVDAVRRVLRVRGDKQDPTGALEGLGLGGLARRDVRGLDAGERRAVGLALALCHERAALLCLFEPLSRVAGVDRATVRDALMRSAEAGAVVLAVTASVHDAIEVSPTAHCLENGRLVRQVVLSSGYEAGVGCELAVRSGEVRRLARALADEPRVSGIRWDPRLGSSELRVLGAEPAELSMAVLGVAEREAIVLDALHVCHRSIEAIQAESAGLARASYEAAYRMQAPGPEASPAATERDP